jgi:RHS repeat-associated protein
MRSGKRRLKYDPDSDLKATVFPSETKDEDTYAYNDAGEMSEVKMLKGTETLASLAYTRDNDGHVKGVTSKGLPGEEKPAYEYDANSRLTKGAGIAYEYDSANNPTKIGAGAYKYNSGDELETGPSLTYAYNEEGQRTKTAPATGPATTYGYDQAGNLISVERPKEGETSEIKDSYAYNGDGLRVSQTISGATTYMAWDTAEELPLLLSDGTNSYIYGPGGLPVEQISSGGTTTYLHHDQQGSTRLLTGSAGTVTGKCTYTPYGVPTCEGTATTPLGFDGQYTSSDTGLIYLRARVYDPATAQFLTVDPDLSETQEPYGYAGDNPLIIGDPTGRSLLGFALEAAHYIITAGAIVGCAAQPELCATAALFDVLLNSADTGAQAALHEKSIASALKEEVFTLVGGAVSFGSAKFWGELTEWARAKNLLGTSASDIARNSRLLNSGAVHWNVVQAAVSKLIQEKEGKCTRTN